MSDERTDEQRAADDALRHATEAALSAYTDDGQARMLMDAAVVIAYTFFDEDGDQVTGHHTFPITETAHYRAIGMLDIARRSLINEYFGGDE